MSWRNVVTVYAKELRDLLRDRRTIMSMIIVPTLLMPGLTMATVLIARRVVERARATAPTIMIVGAARSPNLREVLEHSETVKVVPTKPDWQQRIVDKRVQAAVQIPDDFDARLESGKPAEVTIFDYRGEVRSSNAAEKLQTLLSGYRQKIIGARLSARGLAPEVIKPFNVETKNIAPPERVGGNLFGGMIPYFFILLSFTGAMYPALDLTAGEKERGTMETILCSPVGRLELVLGKFLMVLTASLGTVICSVGATLVTLTVLGAAWGGRAPAAAAQTLAAGDAMPAIDPVGLVGVVIMVIPVAVLFAAVQFTLALFAKSFKEAQSYVSPLIIVIILPAVIGMLPGVELNARLALVPILNVSLVSKELVSGVWHWDFIALIFGSTCVYAAVALGLAVKMFNREDVIFRA